MKSMADPLPFPSSSPSGSSPAGHAEAQWHLGHAFKDGTVVQQSNVEAYAWFRCAVVSAELVKGDAEIAGLHREGL